MNQDKVAKPLDRPTALKLASELLAKLQGLKKNRDYRTIQNDLLAVADTLQVVVNGYHD